MKSTFKRNTVVVIDAGVENYQQLIDGVEPEAKTFLLDKTLDGIEQIDRVLQLHRETNALHIISHGSPGCLYLGNGQLSLDTLGRYAPQLQRWKLDNLLLYGCNVAAGDAGEELIAKLHRLTGAEIAASTSLTGAAAKGGNWELEVTTGKAVTALAFEDATLESYPAILTFTDSGQALGSSNSYSVSLADVDGDGDVDAFVANERVQPNKVWLNDGSGNFTESGQELETFRSVDVSLADVDGDGDVDAFLANWSGQPNKVLLNDGSGNFSDSGQELGSSVSRGVSLADVDGDGDVDAFVANDGQPNKVWLNDGSGNFTDSGQELGRFNSPSVSLTDVDGDGDQDAFVVNWSWNSGQPNKVWLNDGNGNFSDSGQELGSFDSWDVSLADVDGDGDQDAFVANWSGHPNKVWLNDGSGNFTDSGQELGSFDSLGVSLADVDGDGDQDAFVTNSNQGNKVWLNDGSGNFTDSGQELGSFFSIGVSLADVDGDGDQDAFVANWSDRPNKVWLNESLNSAPTVFNLDNNRINENVAANTVVGTFSTTDPDASDTFTYQLVAGTGDTDNAAFTIVGDQLQINSSPDFETQSSYSIRVQTTDAGGLSYSEDFTININDVNEDPTDLNLSNNSINENSAANTVVGTFSTTDPDAGDTFTYQLVAGTGDTDNAAFTIVGDQLQINSSPDYETQSSYSIRVQTTDAGGLSYSEDFTININSGNSGVFNLQLEVAKNIGGSSYDRGNGIATDSNGNVWATGEFYGSIDIDSDGSNDLTSNGNADSYVAKFDSNGDLVLALNIGGSSSDSGLGIATDSNGNVWATGTFSGSVDIDSDGNNDLTSNGLVDSYVAKFDSNGDLVLALNIGGSSSDSGLGIATDSNGNVWATGWFGGSIDIDSDGNNDLTSNGNADSYVAKFDSNGDLVFALNIGGSSSDYGRAIATDSNGNVWATGEFYGSIDIDSDGSNDLTSNGNADSYVAKFDSNGDLVFALNIGGSSRDWGRAIATDSNGNVWATGQSYGSIDIDSDGSNDLTSNGDQDSYVAKFDSNGNLVFALNIGGSSTDYGNGIATDSNGNAWATGSFEDSIDIDSDGNNDLTSNGDEDSYVAKFDSNGDLVLALNIGSSSRDTGLGIATDSNGNAWATGYFQGSIDIDSDGNNDLTSNGDYDSYVVKFSEATNAAPTDLNLDNNSIDENVAANTVVGTFSTTDPDTGDTFTYQLVAGTGDADNPAFTIVGNQLQINSSPDYETQSSYGIRVQTTDGGGESYSENFTININDVNEDPTDPTTITGTSQSNILRGTASGETIQGLAGRDRLYGNGGNDTVEGGDGNDILYGQDGDDLLDGGAGNDRLYGDGGKDTLLGGDGNDILYGKDGDDLLNGGAGRDRLYGNAGSDTFVLAAGMGRDTIYDFSDGTDKIELGGGLSFAELDIVGSGSSTLIKILDTGETLATLRGVDDTLIGADDFV